MKTTIGYSKMQCVRLHGAQTHLYIRRKSFLSVIDGIHNTEHMIRCNGIVHLNVIHLSAREDEIKSHSFKSIALLCHLYHYIPNFFLQMLSMFLHYLNFVFQLYVCHSKYVRNKLTKIFKQH